MRTLTIGRGDDCDIIVNDPQNQISRRHALLRIYPLGKKELVPLGRNGTFRNGQALRNDKAVEVKTGDVISFAHVKQLDWKLVHNPYKPYYISIFTGLGIVLLLFVILLIKPYFPDINFGSGDTPMIIDEGTRRGGGSDVALTDTIKISQDTIKKEEKVKDKILPTRKKNDNKKEAPQDNKKSSDSNVDQVTNEAPKILL